MHSLSSVYFANQPLHDSGIFVAHHQEVYFICTTKWYVLCFLVDGLLSQTTDSQLKRKISTNCCIHKVIETSLPEDDLINDRKFSFFAVNLLSC